MKPYRDGQKELIILTEHFAPSTGATAQLVSDLADDLHRMGVPLRVLTSRPGPFYTSYPVLCFSRPNILGTGILTKIVSGVFFSFGALLWLIANIQCNQTIFIVSNPPFVGLIGVLVSLLRGNRYSFLYQDIFPRSASLTGILPAQGPFLYLWRALLRTVLKRSNLTIVLSESMRRRCILEYGTDIPLASVCNWAVHSPQSKSKKESSLASTWGIEDIFTLQYSGNFGRLHEILTILEAARLLQDQPVKFLFVGGGAKSEQIQRYCDKYALQNVVLKPYQPRNLLPDSLAACDMSIVSMIPGAEDTVAPSKFYGIIASSRPVILISSQDSELASEVLTSRTGIVVPHGDVTLLSESIIHLKDNIDIVNEMGSRARRLYEHKYGRQRSTTEYYRLFSMYDLV